MPVTNPTLRAHISWGLSEKALRLLSSMVIGALVARTLGPGNYGLLNFAISAAGILSILPYFGMDEITVRDIVNNPPGTNTTLGSVFILRLTGAGAVCIILSVFAVYFKGASVRNNMVLLCALPLIFQTSQVYEFFLRTQMQNRLISFMNIAGLLISCVYRLLLIFYKAPLYCYAAAGALESAVICISACITAYSQGVRINHWKASTVRMKELLRDSWPVALSSVVILIYMKIDQLMLSWIQNDYATGLYAAAARISESWYFVPMSLSGSLLPVLLKKFTDRDPSLPRDLGRYYRLFFWGSAAVGLGITVFSRIIIAYMFGPEYQASAQMLTIHIWAGVFVSIGLLNGKWELMQNLQKITMYRTVIGSVINIALNLLLIPKMSGVGASLATLAAYSVSGYFALWFFPSSRAHFYFIVKSVFSLRLNTTNAV